jgi:hypothetical protein
VGDRYCSLSPARPFGKIEASTDLSEELPKNDNLPNFFQLEAAVPIGRQSVKYRLVHTVGAIRTSAPELCISVRQWPERLGRRAVNRSIEKEAAPPHQISANASCYHSHK